MYAITSDFDLQRPEQLHSSEHWRNAYADMRQFLEVSGFENKQGSVYFAVGEIDVAECIAVDQDLADEYDGFVRSVRDSGMLRIDENNDLTTVLDRKRRRRRSN